MVKAGFGKSKITPPVGCALVGYFEPRISNGIRDDLEAASLCLDDGKNVVFVAALDLVWVEKSVTRKTRALIRDLLKLPDAQVILHGTHTHTGPLPGRDTVNPFTDGFYVPDEYLERLPYMIVESLKQSYEERRPAGFGFAKTRVEGISFIRRYLMKSGMVVTNPTKTGEIVSPVGIIDRDLAVMKITDKDGNLYGLAMNYPLHPDTLGDTRISSDWPGLLRRKVEDAYDGRVNAVLFNGPCGDVNHIDPFSKGTRNPDIGEKIADALSLKTIALEKDIDTTGLEFIKFATTQLRMPKRKITKKDVLQAQTIVQAYPANTLKTFIAKSILAQSRNKAKYLSNEFDVLALEEKAAIFAIAGEPFCEYGLWIKQMSPYPFNMILENSNSFFGYIPTDAAFRQAVKNQQIQPDEFPAIRVSEAIGMEASYETSPLSCAVGPGSEKVFIRGVKEILNKI
jgi:hypothetical protein